MQTEEGLGYADTRDTSSVGADPSMMYVDSFRTDLALHECASVVAREFLGLGEYETRLNAIYGTRGTGRDESVADAPA